MFCILFMLVNPMTVPAVHLCSPCDSVLRWPELMGCVPCWSIHIWSHLEKWCHNPRQTGRGWRNTVSTCVLVWCNLPSSEHHVSVWEPTITQVSMEPVSLGKGHRQAWGRKWGMIFDMPLNDAVLMIHLENLRGTDWLGRNNNYLFSAHWQNYLVKHISLFLNCLCLFGGETHSKSFFPLKSFLG